MRGADDSASSALRRISKLYPLQELVRRPLLLSMVVSTLDEFDQDARISKAEVFEKYLARWLEQTRHQGDPEVFSPPQKEALAEALAEQLWRSGRAACSPMELEHTTRAVLLRELPGDIPPDAAILEVFGGSFFVREGADRFRFAHKSFLEFFLARSLVRTLPERPVEALTTRPITQEVAAFVGELLRRDGEPKRSLTYQSLRSWLTVGRRASAATPEAVALTAPAAANALRLLLGLGRWSSETSGWLPEGTDLRKVSFQDLEGASLVAADLSEANLSGADLSGADLSRAILRGVRLSGACLDSAVLTGADGTRVDLTQAAADGCRLETVNFAEAVLRQSCWTDCSWQGAALDRAVVTLWAAPGARELEGAGRGLLLAPSSCVAGIAAGHAGGVSSVAWSGNGRRLASAGGRGISIWDISADRVLAVIEFAGPAWLTRTSGGFCVVADEKRSIQLAANHPEQSATTWYLPLAGLRNLIHRPDKVQAALAGDLSGGDLAAELARRGWGDGRPWDGRVHQMPATVSTPRARDVETARVEPPAASEASRFLPGRALTKTPNPPGREAILIELLTLLQNRSPSILLGPRRAGKTSILHAIKLRLGDGYKVRHITLEGTKLRTDDLTRALEPELEDDARPAKTLRKRLRREPQPILLIDEIVHLREADPQAFAWLRAIGQGEVGVLVAGSAWDWTRVVDRANETPGSSFGNDVTPIDLGPIGEHDARAFLVSGGVGDQAAT